MFPLQYDRLESEKIRKKEGKTPKGYKDKMIHQVPLQEAPQEASQGMLDPRPKDVNSSPYRTDAVNMYIGPNRACYPVAKGFLSESAQWPAKVLSSWPPSPSCIELPEVPDEVGHTLVNYLYTGTYQTLQSQDNEDKVTALRRNVRLYGVAIKYGLAGLATLAQEKIENIGEVAIFDILGIIKEAFQTLFEDYAGLNPYIKTEIKKAFEIDAGLFEKDTFIELFGEAKHFDRILMRVVAELFAEKMAAIHENTQLTTNGFTSEAIDATENSAGISQPDTLSEEPATVMIEDRIAECHEAEIAGEAPTGEQSWKATTPGKELTSVACAEPTESASIPFEEATSLAYTEPAPVSSKEITSYAYVEPAYEESAPVHFEEVTAAVPDEASAPFDQAASESVPPTERSGKKKKSKKGQEIPLSENEQSQTGIKKTKKKGKMKSSSLSEIENGAASQEEVKREKGRKGKKKKLDSGSDLVFELSPPVPTSFGGPDILEPIGPLTPESSVCASQAEHLLNADMWKTCIKCHALIGRLSKELAKSTTAAEDGFEIIGELVVQVG